MPSRLTPSPVSRRPVRAAVGASAVALVRAACASGATAGGGPSGAGGAPGSRAAGRAGGPLTLDDCGFEVTFDAAPERVVTIKSSTTEMLLALGLGDRIVASAFADGPVPDSLADAAADVPAGVERRAGSFTHLTQPTTARV